MMRKYLYGLVSFVLAFAILSVSVLRSSSVPQARGYTAPTPSTVVAPSPTPAIDYTLPYSGRIHPDNWFWYFKVIRDRLQYMITRDPLKKADLALLFSDKRLSSSQILFENGKPDLAVSTLTKGEKYLEQAVADEAMARSVGINTTDFLIKLANASLRHRQIIEEKLIPLSPEDIKPVVTKAEDYAKNTYKSSRDALNSKGIAVPKDPFNGQ